MGGDMREIVDPEQIGRLFAVLAILLPPLGLLVGWWHGRRRQIGRLGVLYGLAVGLLGPLNWALWHVYNRITDSVGLDTVRNLVINVALFIVVGAFIGVGAGLALRRIDETPGKRQPTDGAE